MVYRGVVKDGVIVLEGGAALPEGMRVEVLGGPTRTNGHAATKTRRGARAGAASRTAGAALSRKRMSKSERLATAMAACGSWKDRREWKGRTSAAIAAGIRRRAARRAGRG